MAEISIRSFSIALIALRETGQGVEVLLLRRNHTLVGEWCQIAGGIEEGETAWEAALRELKEETGLTPERFYSGDVCEQFYEADRDAIVMAPVFVAFIDPNAVVVLNEEHSDYGWVSFNEAREMVPFAGQRRVLQQVEDEFIKGAPSAHLMIEIPSG